MSSTSASTWLPIVALLALPNEGAQETVRALPALHHARSAHAVVSTGSALYVLAGTGADDGEVAHVTPVLEVERFDGKAWSVETKLEGGGLNAPASVVLGRRIYLVGGFDALTNHPTDEVRVYDLDAHAWTRAGRLPSPRGGHAAVALDGKIHVLGGGNSVSTLADHDEYDPATDAWTARAPLPRAKGSPAAAVLEGRIWVIGGRSGQSDFGEVDLWDPRTDAWSSGPAIEARGTAGAVAYRGTLWVVGGESQERGACLDEVLRLDRAGNRWMAATPLPTARNYARAVLLGDEICVVGGNVSAGSSHAAVGSRIVEGLRGPRDPVPGK